LGFNRANSRLETGSAERRNGGALCRPAAGSLAGPAARMAEAGAAAQKLAGEVRRRAIVSMSCVRHNLQR
jgi:hypothetical protein